MNTSTTRLSRQIIQAIAGLLCCLALSGPASAHEIHQQIQGQFASTRDVTVKCLECHRQQAEEVLHSTHWTWVRQRTLNGKDINAGKKDSLAGYAIEFNDEDPGDAFGTVVVDFQGHTVSYRTTRWQTLPPRQTELHAVVVRRTVGARLGQTQVRLDGADLVAETPAPDTLSLPQLTNTALCLGAAVAGGDVLTGHVYALGVWNSVLSDADVLAVEAWARKAIARTADTRGILVGSVQP